MMGTLSFYFGIEPCLFTPSHYHTIQLSTLFPLFEKEGRHRIVRKNKGNQHFCFIRGTKVASEMRNIALYSVSAYFPFKYTKIGL